jgi:hypothetical protein
MRVYRKQRIEKLPTPHLTDSKHAFKPAGILNRFTDWRLFWVSESQVSSSEMPEWTAADLTTLLLHLYP